MKTIYDLATYEYETLEEALDALKSIASLSNDADNHLNNSFKNIRVLLLDAASEIVNELEDTKEIIY